MNKSLVQHIILDVIGSKQPLLSHTQNPSLLFQSQENMKFPHGCVYMYLPSCYTDEVAVVTHLAFKEVLTFSCILKHEDFEMKANWLQKRIPRAILGLEIMYVYFFNARRIITSPAWQQCRCLQPLSVTNNGRSSIMLLFGHQIINRATANTPRKHKKATQGVLKACVSTCEHPKNSRGALRASRKQKYAIFGHLTVSRRFRGGFAPF